MEQNGVLDACKELGITVLAYSPLGRGELLLFLSLSLSIADVSMTMSRFPHWCATSLDDLFLLVQVLMSLAVVCCVQVVTRNPKILVKEIGGLLYLVCRRRTGRRTTSTSLCLTSFVSPRD